MKSTKNIKFNLIASAQADMVEHGIKTDFPQGTDTELSMIESLSELPVTKDVQDLRGLLWSSIDNDTSKYLDHIEWAEQLQDGRIRVLIGVADVDVRVPRGSLLD